MRSRLMSKCGFLLSIAGAVIAFSASVARGTPDASAPVNLPSDPAAWINSGPLSVELLDGKGAVLWFFEETCPRCRGKWPAMLEMAKQYEGQPIVFIAVNSGTPRAAIEQYVKQCSIEWPVLLDPTRDFERLADVGQISLQNINQACVITPDGKLVRARWDDLEGAARMALEGAKWTLDPKEIPPSLAPAFKAVGLGMYSNAAPSVRKGRASADPTTKAAAEKIDAIVQKKIASAAAEAHVALDAGDKYTALERLTDIARQFAGFDLPEDLTRRRQELARHPQVKSAIKAARDIETVQRMLTTAGANPATRNRAQAILKQAAKDAAGTQVGRRAEELLSQLGGQ